MFRCKKSLNAFQAETAALAQRHGRRLLPVFLFVDLANGIFACCTVLWLAQAIASNMAMEILSGANRFTTLFLLFILFYSITAAPTLSFGISAVSLSVRLKPSEDAHLSAFVMQYTRLRLWVKAHILSLCVSPTAWVAIAFFLLTRFTFPRTIVLDSFLRILWSIAALCIGSLESRFSLAQYALMLAPNKSILHALRRSFKATKEKPKQDHQPPLPFMQRLLLFPYVCFMLVLPFTLFAVFLPPEARQYLPLFFYTAAFLILAAQLFTPRGSLVVGLAQAGCALAQLTPETEQPENAQEQGAFVHMDAPQ